MTSQPGMFVVKPDRSLLGLTEAPYESEESLQELIARYPDLLAGGQMNPEVPRRWLLVTRELGVPDEQAGSDRWSLDHLFLDQDGIPTLVEVKQSKNTDIRRKVVGQMLDYAANSIVYWPLERIRAAFAARCAKEGRIAEEELQNLLGAGVSAESFWLDVKTNLQAGKIRLLFVADSIPAELRRIVEFLNRQMDPAEVLAVEVRQFVGEDLRTLMPLLVGADVKPPTPRPGRSWDEASFFKKLDERGVEAEHAVARMLFDWAIASQLRVDYGKGTTVATFIPVYEAGDAWFVPFRVTTGYTAAFVEIPLGQMAAPPFDDPAVKKELVRRINAIEGIGIRDDPTKFPSLDLTKLAVGDRLQQFLKATDWVISRVRETQLAT